MPWKEAIGERIDVLAWRAVEHGRARGGGRRKEEWRERDEDAARRGRSEQLVRKIKEREGLVRSPATGWMRTRTRTRGLQERGMETLGEKRREREREGNEDGGGQREDKGGEGGAGEVKE